MKPFLIDSHCHIQDSQYNQDREAVLGRMADKKRWGIAIGTSLINSQKALLFAESRNNFWATVGLHPEYLTSDFINPADDPDIDRFFDAQCLQEIAASSKKIVAIGETGLDFYRIPGGAGSLSVRQAGGFAGDEGRDQEEAKQKQEKVFREHLLVARQLNLPVVIHCRDALSRLAEILQEEVDAGRAVSAVVHSFTGTWQEAKPLLDLGCYIAVNGIATFPLKKNQNPEETIDRTIERMPIDRLLIETDAPYLAPTPFRGKRNEPAWVEEVAKHVAKVRHMTLEEIAELTTGNAQKLFSLN